MSESDKPESGRIVLGRKVAAGPLSPELRSEFTYSIVAAPAAAPADKRRNERLRTRLRAAHLADRGDKVIMECLIQDRSRTGARLRLALDRPLPKAFILSDDIGRTQFWAQLAWQRGRDAGVRFLSLPRSMG